MTTKEPFDLVSSMKKTLCLAGAFLLDLLPLLAYCLGIPVYGLLVAIVGCIFEFLFIPVRRLLLKDSSHERFHLWIQFFASSLGIFIGYVFYPIPSHPQNLGDTVVLLILALHAIPYYFSLRAK